jgi:hypothetical protein
MEKLPEGWIRRPKIDIDHQHILRVNNRVIDILDTIPETFSAYIEFARPKIEQQLAIMRKMRRYSDDNDEQPSIFMGRLAIIGSEDRLFNDVDMALLKANAVGREDLKREYHPYWNCIERAKYQPVVYPQVFSSEFDYGGTWLGLQRPET